MLQDLAGLLEATIVTPWIDRIYPLTQESDAMRHLETGHVRGRTASTM